MNSPRTLPHSLDAEAGVLGGILLRPATLAELPDLEVEDFYDHKHKCVFQAMRNLEAKSRSIDYLTVEEELRRTNKHEAVGGAIFIAELTMRVPTIANVILYAEIVRNKHQMRKLMVTASEVIERGYEDDLELAEFLDDSEAKLLAATARKTTDEETLNIGKAIKLRMAQIERDVAARERGQVALTGVPTGIESMDTRLGGWQFGIVSAIAGRPGMGKTSCSIASAVASADAGFGVHVFSLEEPYTMYADRCVSRESGVPAEKIRAGLLQRADLDPISRAMGKLYKHRDRWLVDDRGGISARDIVRAVRRHRNKNKTRLVIVDHLQIVGRSHRLDENAALEEIINTFAAAAKDKGDGGDLIAWVVLCQLNRKVEERTDRRPQLADLRGSGAIEQSTRCVVMQYRGAYYGGEPQKDVDYECDCRPEPGYGKNSKPVWPQCDHKPSADKFEHQVQLIIAKNNNGPTGRVFAEWDGPTMTIR